MQDAEDARSLQMGYFQAIKLQEIWQGKKLGMLWIINTVAPRKHGIIGQYPLPAWEFSHVESRATVIKL